jgi:hypothetical protein
MFSHAPLADERPAAPVDFAREALPSLALVYLDHFDPDETLTRQ